MAQESYDAIVVGSGASGGWAARTLCEAGLRVLMLEAGRALDPERDFSEHLLPHDLPLRGRRDPRNLLLERRPIQKRCYACEETNADFFVDDLDNPYTTAPGKSFTWIQGNVVGGRTITWGRQCYRLSDLDFKAASHDGYGVDWPISYADLEPYYDRIERSIGVSGRGESLPQLPDGQFLPPMRMSCGEVMLRDAVAEKLGGRVVTVGRCAVLTRRHQGRDACHYCGPCHRGCRTDSYWSSPTTTIAASAATGRFTLITDAHVRHVLMDGENRARGVYYFDKTTGAGREAFGGVVVLCASTLASTRILLNSAEGGLGNESGVLGHYLMDHIYATGVGGALPMRHGAKAEEAIRPNGIYVPRFVNLPDPATKKKRFIRGYGYQGGENITVYEHARSIPGFGAELKQAIRGTSHASLLLAGFGEILPRKENRVTLDPEKRDKWGTPVLRIECSLGDNERAMIDDIVEEGRAMLEAVGAEKIMELRFPMPMGTGIHEVGTARMGADPKQSYVNQHQQSHEIANLFVMDGSCYPSIGCVNPTLTMMALALRSSEYLVEQMKRGELV